MHVISIFSYVATDKCEECNSWGAAADPQNSSLMSMFSNYCSKLFLLPKQYGQHCRRQIKLLSWSNMLSSQEKWSRVQRPTHRILVQLNCNDFCILLPIRYHNTSLHQIFRFFSWDTPFLRVLLMSNDQTQVRTSGIFRSISSWT